MLDDYQISQDRDLPKKAWDFMREKGFLGMVIPQEYGESASGCSTDHVYLSIACVYDGGFIFITRCANSYTTVLTVKVCLLHAKHSGNSRGER